MKPRELPGTSRRSPVVAAIGAMLCASAVASASPQGPQPGEVYREFAAHQGGNDWRVTNPLAASESARQRLPNPVLHVAIDRIEGAVRAEAVLDHWGGHINTTRPQIRFNAHSWLDVPPPLAPPGKGDHPTYYIQDNPLIEVPLDHLKAGDNTFEGTASHADPTGWGLWGLYSLIVRVYYDPAKTPHPAGRIVSPADGATIGENPRISVEASAPNGVGRVDLLGWYEGYDENGDGVWRDWHGGYFQPLRGRPAELREHIGTLWRSPYEITWDTRWVPDQEPGAVKLVARIQDSQGTWAVTRPATGLTLRRHGQSVRLFRPGEIPPRFGVRNKARKSCMIPIAAEFDLNTAVEAGLHLRTWHGWDGAHQPLKLNDWTHPIGGKNHHFDYDILLVPPSALRAGDKVFAISSEYVHHALEVHWPGPALTVRFRTGAAAQSTGGDNPAPAEFARFERYTEGPAFDREGNLYVSHGRDTVSRISPDGRCEVWLKVAAPNGHKILPDGTHLLCAGAAVLRVGADGTIIGDATEAWKGTPLRAPNDLTLDGRGGFYFTDPGGSQREPVGRVFHVAGNGAVAEVAGGMRVPNGVVLSPDGERLYVAETVPNRIVWFAVGADGRLGPLNVLAELPGTGEVDGPDGLAVDAAGNLYVAHLTVGKIHVLSPAGELVRSLPAGNSDASNLAWGGAELGELYITGSLGHRSRGPGRVFRIKLDGIRGAPTLPPREIATPDLDATVTARQ